MKWVLISFFLFSPSWAAIAVVSAAHTIAQSATSNSVTTSAIDTTGSNFLVVSLAYASAVTLTDSKSNTWTPRTAYTGSGISIQLFYSTAPVVGSGHTFTASCSACFPSLAVQGFSGVNTAAYDAENGFHNIATTIQPGNVAPAQDNELMISGHQSAIGGSVSINSGFTITDQGGLVGGLAYGIALAYLINGTGTSGININPTWTSSGSDTSACTLAAFKPTATVAASFGIINNPVFGRF